MRNTLTAFLLLFSFIGTAQNAIDLNYYLPQNVTYDANIPKPADIIGHEVGEWHVTHDKLVFYMQTLAEKSNRISIENWDPPLKGDQSYYLPLHLLKTTLIWNR